MGSSPISDNLLKIKCDWDENPRQDEVLSGFERGASRVRRTFAKRTKFFEAKSVDTFNASDSRQSHLRQFIEERMCEMKVYSIGSDLTFGNKKGGIEHLNFIKEGNTTRLVSVPKEASGVSVFVAGGAEIDRLVHKANLSRNTIKNIERTTGLTYKELTTLPFDEASKLMKERGTLKEPSKIKIWFADKYRAIGERLGFLEKNHNIYTDVD